jgi:23S rRNA G2069 N7-methylase RlmK/C1962 C5-methylase RlmI
LLSKKHAQSAKQCLPLLAPKGCLYVSSFHHYFILA